MTHVLLQFAFVLLVALPWWALVVVGVVGVVREYRIWKTRHVDQ